MLYKSHRDFEPVYEYGGKLLGRFEHDDYEGFKKYDHAFGVDSGSLEPLHALLIGFSFILTAEAHSAQCAHRFKGILKSSRIARQRRDEHAYRQFAKDCPG